MTETTATLAAQPLLTIEQVAKRLGIGRSLAWRLVREGALPSVRLGRLVRVPQTALDHWIDEQATGERR
jgi:excisionase family DNA binding protein